MYSSRRKRRSYAAQVRPWAESFSETDAIISYRHQGGLNAETSDARTGQALVQKCCWPACKKRSHFGPFLGSRVWTTACGETVFGEPFWETIFGEPFVGNRCGETVFRKPFWKCWRVWSTAPKTSGSQTALLSTRVKVILKGSETIYDLFNTSTIGFAKSNFPQNRVCRRQWA